MMFGVPLEGQYRQGAGSSAPYLNFSTPRESQHEASGEI